MDKVPNQQEIDDMVQAAHAGHAAAPPTTGPVVQPWDTVKLGRLEMSSSAPSISPTKASPVALPPAWEATCVLFSMLAWFPPSTLPAASSCNDSRKKPTLPLSNLPRRRDCLAPTRSRDCLSHNRSASRR
jgi:hypothetical protein